ncbi:MAG TPA: type II secretion system protein [Tepidisphaeraceae bacterium]|nr:type II secretion system protein [Tepidisphaeraceae bacterium]
MASPIRATNRRRGFTMYEAVLASVVLAFTVIAVSGSLTASNTQTQVLQQTATAVSLCRELLEEIASVPMTNPATGTTAVAANATSGPRSGFGYVGAYNNYTDSAAALPEINGSTLDVTDGQTYTRSVTVTLGAKPSNDSASPGTDFALVTVKVTTPLGLTVTMQRVFCNYPFSR